MVIIDTYNWGPEAAQDPKRYQMNFQNCLLETILVQEHVA